MKVLDWLEEGEQCCFCGDQLDEETVSWKHSHTPGVPGMVCMECVKDE